MSDTNIVLMHGRLVKDATLKYTAAGVPCCEFSIANNESFKNDTGGYNDTVSFFDCVLWGKYGESIHKYLRKGRSLILTGRLIQSRWEKDGQKFSRVNIKIDNLELLPDTRKITGQQSDTTVEQPDNIPF